MRVFFFFLWLSRCGACSHFLENADFPNGGMADWGTGMGQLEVYLDDLVSPVLVTPLNLNGLLHLYHGRAWVGFTGATGLSTWQTQVSHFSSSGVQGSQPASQSVSC